MTADVAKLDTNSETDDLAPQTAAADAQAKGKKPLPEIPIAERADVQSIDDLARVLRLHAAWIEAVMNPSAEVAAGRANLEGVDLRPYDLVGVNLSGANLQNAILTGCDLSQANFMAANLQGAQLQDCKLHQTKLSRAKLDGADLRGSDLSQALLSGVDLSKVITRASDDEASATTSAVNAPAAEINI